MAILKRLELKGGGLSLLRTVLWTNSLQTGKNTGNFEVFAQRLR
jgi:hypothetical protein